ncbi:toxin VasX [Pseudomonas frederiksbergensis]|uniref:toxin VasX n=1 Tax=Pseudomonas frederiksbergensis TaxID=104087 RepID=UPI000B1444F2|nr:toxin VasX [Pseudomonas frederiksbergensis]
MTTPTSAGKNPNNVAKSRDDGKCAMGGCPLMKAKIQLIPLRYGLVERLDPSSALAMPYQLTSRPLGVRLIRDGWLYVIVDKKPQAVMHEYRVQNGIVTQLLWEKGEITANKRESNVGDAALIFPRLSKLYVNYSEVQWTAAKCAQVIKHKSEREYFMQAVDLTKADPEKGAANLLTPSQAEKWIAEVAEQPSKGPAVTGAKPEESKDYLWEQTPHFKKTQLGELKKQVKAECEHDHLYLVVQDDLGVLRDLAEHQDLVTGWISDWSDAEANQKKYVFGCYIESLYTVTGDTILNAAKGDPRFAKLKDETSDEQRQTIVDYVNVKNQSQYSGAGTHSGAIAASKMRMRTSLGPLYSRYDDLIETIEDNADDALNGAKMGQDGINDLIDRPAMEAFLKQQRAQLSRWNKRLDLITDDRVKLVGEERFHRSAWYFDPDFSNQLEGSLATEYACLKDICRTDKATEAIAELIEKQPGFTVPTFFTLSLTDQKDLHAKITSTIKSLRDTYMVKNDYQGAQTLSGKFGNQLGQNLAAAMHLSESGITFDQLRNTAYEPAKQLRLAGAMDEAMQALRSGQAIDPAKLLRRIPGSAWLDVLRAFGKGGITLEFASAGQIDTFKADMAKLTDLRQQMTSLKNQIRQTLAKERKGKAAKGSHKTLVTHRKTLQQTVTPLEGRVAQAMSPVGEGPGKAAFKIKGLNNTQVLEFQRMADDYRLKRPFKGVSRAVFTSAGGICWLRLLRWCK